MYASRTTQFIVGIFAVLGIAALGYLSMRLGRIALFPAPGYVLHADFDNISGLKVGDQVQVAGVPVGKVVEISLPPDGERARVEMRLNKGVQIDSDAIAGIKLINSSGSASGASSNSSEKNSGSANPGPGCPPSAGNSQGIGNPGKASDQKKTK